MWPVPHPLHCSSINCNLKISQNYSRKSCALSTTCNRFPFLGWTPCGAWMCQHTLRAVLTQRRRFQKGVLMAAEPRPGSPRPNCRTTRPAPPFPLLRVCVLSHPLFCCTEHTVRTSQGLGSMWAQLVLTKNFVYCYDNYNLELALVIRECISAPPPTLIWWTVVISHWQSPQVLFLGLQLYNLLGLRSWLPWLKHAPFSWKHAFK